MKTEHFRIIDVDQTVKKTLIMAKDYYYGFDLSDRFFGRKAEFEYEVEREKEHTKYLVAEQIAKFVEVKQDKYNPYRYEARLSLPLIYSEEINELKAEVDKYREQYYESEEERMAYKKIIKSAKKWYLKILDCVLYEKISKVG